MAQKRRGGHSIKGNVFIKLMVSLFIGVVLSLVISIYPDAANVVWMGVFAFGICGVVVTKEKVLSLDAVQIGSINHRFASVDVVERPKSKTVKSKQGSILRHKSNSVKIYLNNLLQLDENADSDMFMRRLYLLKDCDLGKKILADRFIRISINKKQYRWAIGAKDMVGWEFSFSDVGYDDGQGWIEVCFNRNDEIKFRKFIMEWSDEKDHWILRSDNVNLVNLLKLEKVASEQDMLTHLNRMKCVDWKKDSFSGGSISMMIGNKEYSCAVVGLDEVGWDIKFVDAGYDYKQGWIRVDLRKNGKYKTRKLIMEWDEIKEHWVLLSEKFNYVGLLRLKKNVSEEEMILHLNRIKGLEWEGDITKEGNIFSYINGEAYCCPVVGHAVHDDEKMKVKFVEVGCFNGQGWVQVSYPGSDYEDRILVMKWKLNKHWTLKEIDSGIFRDMTVFSLRASYIKILESCQPKDACRTVPMLNNVEAEAELRQIRETHAKSILEFSLTKQFDFVNAEAIEILRNNESHHDLAAILENIIIKIAPPDSELVKDIKVFEKKYRVKVRALNLTGKLNIIITFTENPSIQDFIHDAIAIAYPDNNDQTNENLMMEILKSYFEERVLFTSEYVEPKAYPDPAPGKLYPEEVKRVNALIGDLGISLEEYFEKIHWNLSFIRESLHLSTFKMFSVLRDIGALPFIRRKFVEVFLQNRNVEKAVQVSANELGLGLSKFYPWLNNLGIKDSLLALRKITDCQILDLDKDLLAGRKARSFKGIRNFINFVSYDKGDWVEGKCLKV